MVIHGHDFNPKLFLPCKIKKFENCSDKNIIDLVEIKSQQCWVESVCWLNFIVNVIFKVFYLTLVNVAQSCKPVVHVTKTRCLTILDL